MAYTSETAARNKANARKRPDGNGGLTDKSNLPQSRRAKAKAKLRSTSQKTTGSTATN